MSQRLTRKEMKRDEVREGLFTAVEYVQTHSRQLLWILAGALVAVLVAVGILVMMERRQARASQLLAEALEIYRAPLAGAAPASDDPAGPTFADRASRDARARELLEPIRDRYGDTEAGAVATALLGDIAARRGELEAAGELWREFLEVQEDTFLAVEVRLNLFALERAQGRAEALVEELRGLLAARDKPLPEDVLLHELAITLESVGREDEARETYQRLAEEFPRSPYAGEAQRKLDAAAPGPAPDL